MLRSKVIHDFDQLNNRNVFLVLSCTLVLTDSISLDTSVNDRSDAQQKRFVFNFLRAAEEDSASLPTMSRLDRHRQKAVKLIIVLILEFFICWTPLYLYHTIGTFDKTFYRSHSINMRQSIVQYLLKFFLYV